MYAVAIKARFEFYWGNKFPFTPVPANVTFEVSKSIKVYMKLEK